MADVKSLLKEARKLIDDKNFIEAQECCKNILRKDKQNYLGLILLGKSLQESDQAALAFQKAIANKPDHPLAWQGLANYYERKGQTEAKVKLIAVYDEILKLTNIEEEKALEIITKLGQLGCSLKDNQVITILINYMDKNLDEKIYSAAGKQLIELLKTDMTCKEEDVSKVIDYLTQVINKEPNDALHILLGKVILQKNNFIDAMKKVMDLHFFTSSVTFRQWLCKYLCTYYVQNNSFSGLAIQEHFDDITVGIENSKYPALLRSMILYDKGLYLETYKECVPLVNYQEADITEATYIIRCTFMLKKYSVAQKLAANFLIKVRDKNFAITLKKFLFFSLAEQQKWKQAISIANEIADSLDISEQAVLAKCYIECNEPADHVMKNLQETEHFGQLEALSFMNQGKFEDAIKLLNESLDKPLNLFYIGKAYWKLEQYDNCLICLLKAAKVNTDHADTFLYLGMVYQHYKQDLEKAKKCYEKAFSLNNTNIDIIKNLSDIYTKLGLCDADFDLLSKCSKNVQMELPWISFRLGLHYINKREWENAILQFRNVIKADSNNIIAFECLADAYYSRGSFTSALKAYNKVISMNPKNIVHCLTRIGYINSLLTQYEDAIATFEKVFEIDPNSLLALKGIAETWIRIAKKKFDAKLFGCSRDTAQYAINYLIQALTKEKKFLCFWKLLADTLVFVTKLPKEYCYVYMKNSFIDDSDTIARMGEYDIYPQALACYSRIAKQKLHFSSYDLASTYLDYYHATKEMVNCQIAFKLTIANIKMKPSSWRNWNLLGKICIFMKKYALAQHCFIKALLVTRKWSVAKIWCNLGTLYVKLGLHKLANYCFWRGQSTLPSYPQSWIGQGLIAEVIQEEEAMDLFRHACRLGYHPESAIGYADWVCRTLKDDKNSSEFKYVIDGLYAISYAMDLMLWFIRFEPNNAYANNILGILQERSDLLDSALASYQKAFQYADEDRKNIILLNISRTLLRLGKYDEAIKSYKEITEASLNSACGLALALFKKGLYEESYSAYDTALHWLCNNDDEKSDLLVAMAGIVYMFKGMDDAKTLLFHSIQVSQKKPTPYSLYAICSLGIIHSDQGLSKLALSELQKYEKDSNFGYDIGFLKSYLALTDDVNKAIKILSDSLHDQPNSTELWSCMAQYCLKSSDTKAKIASSCAQRALSSAHHNKKDNDSAKMIATASIAEHIAGNKLKSLLLAKAGLHMYPCQSEIWAALLFSVLTNKIWFEKKTWILSVTGHMRKNLDITRGLSRWINLLEKKLSRYVNS